MIYIKTTKKNLTFIKITLIAASDSKAQSGCLECFDQEQMVPSGGKSPNLKFSLQKANVDGSMDGSRR